MDTLHEEPTALPTLLGGCDGQMQTRFGSVKRLFSVVARNEIKSLIALVM